MESIFDQQVKKWHLLFNESDPEASRTVAELSSALRIAPVTAKLLYLRGYRTVEAANRFFHLEEAEPHDPFLLRDMRLAVERLSLAVERGERIAVYGDYDADGVTSTSLLFLYLSEYGADVDYYIPSRSKEGYGLSKAAIDTLREKGVSLMVTVDTGVTAVEEIAYASSVGIDTIVTDHHECRPKLPKAFAVVNPHRADDNYPFKELAGVGVAFKLVCAMETEKCRREGKSVYEGISRLCNDYADLIAIGTIADVMPVTDENRLFVAKGLAVMEARPRLGLNALIDAASANRGRPRKLTSTYIGFVIAPRMNAAGRMAEASETVKLLLSDNKATANDYAERLCELNAERQSEENRIAEEAYRKIEAMPAEERRNVLVIDSDSWNQGVIGIVSSRVTERYGLPSILITYDGLEDDVGKGSGRSVKGLNLVEALTACGDLLIRYGGHELAAGLSVRRRDVAALRRRLNEYADEHFSEEARVCQIDADCELSVREMTIRLAEEIAMFEPFGSGNVAPKFVLRDARVTAIRPMGGGKHVRLQVEKDGLSVPAVWFGKAVSELPFTEGELADFLFEINVNEYNGVFSLQMLLRDAVPAASDREKFLAEKKRYEEIEAGGCFSTEERLFPDRSDVALVYQFLRRETRNGHTGFWAHRLLGALARDNGNPFPYAKMRIVLRVLRELKLCDYTEPITDYLVFDFCERPEKTDLEQSSVLCRFRSQLQPKPL
ncbi:MAG: single-stranded-DNA-specific exonuclease RecJ [Clostridia bacterium]|nr:single-stranded-DNA-specific exonuclease RecJ [Clostridia bacterium]